MTSAQLQEIKALAAQIAKIALDVIQDCPEDVRNHSANSMIGFDFYRVSNTTNKQLKVNVHLTDCTGRFDKGQQA